MEAQVGEPTAANETKKTVKTMKKSLISLRVLSLDADVQIVVVTNSMRAVVD